MRQDLEKVALNVNDELPRLRTAIEYLTVCMFHPAHALNYGDLL